MAIQLFTGNASALLNATFNAVAASVASTVVNATLSATAASVASAAQSPPDHSGMPRMGDVDAYVTEDSRTDCDGPDQLRIVYYDYSIHGASCPDIERDLAIVQANIESTQSSGHVLRKCMLMVIETVKNNPVFSVPKYFVDKILLGKGCLTRDECVAKQKKDLADIGGNVRRAACTQVPPPELRL